MQLASSTEGNMPYCSKVNPILMTRFAAYLTHVVESWSFVNAKSIAYEHGLPGDRLLIWVVISSSVAIPCFLHLGNRRDTSPVGPRKGSKLAITAHIMTLLQLLGSIAADRIQLKRKQLRQNMRRAGSHMCAVHVPPSLAREWLRSWR